MNNCKYILIFIFTVLFSCQSEQKSSISSIAKLQSSDRYQKTIIKSKYYALNAREDNLIETNNGNVIIIPKGSLLDENGAIVKDSFQIEYAEGAEIDEIILSNLMIQDSAKVYESYLSFFINANQNGKQLRINPSNPIYFEVTAEKQVSLYNGIRDKLGNMTWEKNKDAVDYLIPVSLELLDFYPEGFELAVEKGLPFRGHEMLTTHLLDSLYYSFATELTETGYYNWNYYRLQKINILTPLLSLLAQDEPSIYEEVMETVASDSEDFCGINPASIKAIRNKKFQNTLISTREFESRLKTIFATCDNAILKLYVNNLNKNLWEIDKMAAEQLGSSNNQYQKFLKFASYNQTTVKLSDRKAQLLAEHYKRSKEKVERDLKKLKRKSLKEKQKIDDVARKKKEEYRKLLEKRHSYRMQKFGFELSDFGWFNAASETKLSELEKFNLNITIDNGLNYNRVYSYVINPIIKSIFSYLSDDNQTFDIVYSDDPNLLLWKNQKFKVIGVGYLTDSISYKIETCKQMETVDVHLTLENHSYERFKKDIRAFSKGYKRENKILVDLEYQSFFYKERLRKQTEQQEQDLRRRIRSIVFPCCFGYETELKSFDFDQTDFKDVLSTIEKEFNVSIILENRRMDKAQLSSSFYSSDINEVLDLICSPFGLNYQYKDNAISIY